MTEYSIDVLYAFIQLGLDAGATPDDIQDVVVNADTYRYFTKERISTTKRFSDFFAQRSKLGDVTFAFTDIRKSYHMQAMKLHPDRNRSNKATEEQLKEINAAYALVEAIHREAKDYFKQPESTRREIETEAREAREREAPAKSKRKEYQQTRQEKAPAPDPKANSKRNSKRAKPKATPSGSQASVKYMAASVPRFIRTARLGHIPLNYIIGSRFIKQENGTNYILDVMMLPEQQFIRARTYLSTPDTANPTLQAARFTPPYVLQDTKELLIPANEPDPEAYARNHFMLTFGLIAPGDPP